MPPLADVNTKRTREATEHRAYRIRGRVQGVGFRWWTRTQALRLGVEGTVRNCDDGSVEVWATADVATLAEFRRVLEAGPPGAVVTSVERLDGTAPRSGDGFRIVR